MASTQQTQNPARGERRTQQERTAATTRVLLDATVKCLAQKGYSSTSISQIVEEAGVSRGALLHHYPSKTELVAAAMNHFYTNLSAEVEILLQKVEPDQDSFKQRLAIVNKVYGRNASARIEFMVAARTDPELANAIQQQQHNGGSTFYPQLMDLADPEPLARLISAFLLGNSLMAALEPDKAQSTYDVFVEMIEPFIASQTERT